MTRRPFSAIRGRVVLIVLLVLEGLSVTIAADTKPKTAAAVDMIRKAAEDLGRDQVDAAMRDVSLALELDPKNLAAYELRSAIFIRKKLWDRAESDIMAADKIQPDPAYKYKLGEIKYLQKKYGDARPRFAALRDDPHLGDLATYKVILCDLFGSENAAAARDMAALDPAGKKPSYYFGYAAWYLFHDQRPEADKLFAQAEKMFDTSILNLYVGSLVEAQRLHLPTATFTARDGQKFVHARVSLEAGGLRAATPTGWVTLPLDLLPDDLSTFPEDVRDQISRRRAIAVEQSSKPPPITFTTTMGKTYEQVRWSMQDTGISVVTTAGWVSVPFNQLPSDLSAFPPEVRKTITSKRALPPADRKESTLASFTTKTGRTYDQIAASISRDGVIVLTPNGRVAIPFRDLPDDLSAFPAAWREQIETSREVTDSSGPQRLSFTTRDGKHYDDVRTALEMNGLRVMTDQGLTSVPFNLLPDDLSPFPGSWRKTIALKLKDGGKIVTVPRAASVDANAALNPPHARDCNFGSCVALSGSTMVVGSRGAAYVYNDGQLEARLCPNADSTGTGDAVTSVAISGQTIVAATPRGVFVWMPTNAGWELQDHLVVADVSTVSIDGDHLLVVSDGKGDGPNSATYYARQGDAWLPMPNAAQHDKDTSSADRFGCVAALGGGKALIGVPDWSTASYMKGNGAASGQAFIARFDGSGWTESALLKPVGAPTGANQFGASVALSGNLAAISSGNHDTFDAVLHHGSVYLFRRTASDWQPEAELKSPAPDGGASFGCGPIALSKRTLAVSDGGVRAHSDNVVLDTDEKTNTPGWIDHAGAIYVFEGHDWQATLSAPDPADGLDRKGSRDHFATSLALDGATLLVGAPGKNGGMGAVYIWGRENGRWVLKNELAGFHKQLDFDY